jgi:hypothetical protein
MHDRISELRSFLEGQPRGPVADSCRLAQLLVASWPDLAGSGETKMRADKLWRIEDPQWNPPILTFSIERHGQTVCGSSRASVHIWCVNLESGTGSICGEKRRQLTPMARRLDVKPLAQAVADAIRNEREDESFRLMSDGRIKINIGSIIPETDAQTTIARRRRFRDALSALLEPHGWKQVRPNLYRRLG